MHAFFVLKVCLFFILAPTCVLIKPDGKTLDAFGFGAEDRYVELSEEGSHKQWYFFQRFKLMLLDKVLFAKIFILQVSEQNIMDLHIFV